MKVGQRSLLGYLPAQVIKCVLDGKIKQKQDYPVEYNMNTVALYAELNGITRSDKLSKYGIKNPFSIMIKIYSWMKSCILLSKFCDKAINVDLFIIENNFWFSKNDFNISS